MPLHHGWQPLNQNEPSAKRLPSVNAKPSLLRTRVTAALVFQPHTLLRMPRLNWSEYGALRLLLIMSTSPPSPAATSGRNAARPPKYFGSHSTQFPPTVHWREESLKNTSKLGSADLVSSSCR